ncbi:MAG: Jag N-terminal domain-containing protein [Oscillospiraceae bacterium]|nr:Jag N-terminal domain-containing protein [Oscillospiraceae bacterium]
MPKTYVFEGNTTNAAIEKGLKELKVSKDSVEVKILDNGKKSFFSILEPRVVKVEITLKDKKDETFKRAEKTVRKVDSEDVKKQMEIIDKFLKEFISKLQEKDVNYKIENKDNFINVEITGENVKHLIGYRGETLNALQNILKAISRRHVAFGAKVIVNIEGYRKQREEILKELANKVSKTVIRTKKSVMLEPMSSFERKIIHEQLQNNDQIKTYSIGNEPHRKLVIDLK